MRVLLVTHYFPEHGGGIERVAGELASRLSTRGVQIRWIATKEPIPTAAPGAHPMPGWNGLERAIGVPYPLWGPKSLAAISSATDWADLVHIHDSLYFGNVVAALVAARKRKPVLVTQHIGMVPYRHPLLRAALTTANRVVAIRLLASANHVVFIGRTAEAYWRGLAPIIKSSFIPNGVDQRRFRPATQTQRHDQRRKLGYAIDRPVVLFVGRFVEKKGLVTLQTLTKRFPDVQWVFVGWGPHDPTSWNQHNVRVLGSVAHDALPEVYQSADLLALPSVGEGFPLVVQESMSCGTPVLISTESVRGYPEVGEVCWHAQPSAGPFGDVLQSLLAQPALLDAKRPDVSRFAHAHWDWESCVSEYDALMKNLSH